MEHPPLVRLLGPGHLSGLSRRLSEERWNSGAKDFPEVPGATCCRAAPRPGGPTSIKVGSAGGVAGADHASAEAHKCSVPPESVEHQLELPSSTRATSSPQRGPFLWPASVQIRLTWSRRKR